MEHGIHEPRCTFIKIATICLFVIAALLYGQDVHFEFTGAAKNLGTDWTASRILYGDANNVICSVVTLESWIAGTDYELEVTGDGDGTITVGIVDPVIVAKGGTGLATLTDHGLLLGSGIDAVTPLGVATNGQLPIGSTGADPVLSTLTGTANQLTVTSAAGSITLSTPQNTHTGASPTFAGLYISAVDPEIRMTDTGDSEYTRVTRADTSALATRYNRAYRPGGGGSLDFNISEWVEVEDSISDIDNLSISMWVNCDAWGSVYDVLIATHQAWQNGDLAIATNTSDKLVFVMDDSAGAGGATHGVTLSLGGVSGWHHVVARLSKTTTITGTHMIDMHFDNSNTSMTYTNADAAWTADADNDFRIGGGINGNMIGYIDEVAIWSEVISVNDITDLYNSGDGLHVDPAEDWPTDGGSQGTNLFGLWHFNDGAGDTAADSSGNAIHGTLNPGSGDPTWDTGKVIAPGADVETVVWSSKDGSDALEEGIQTFGDSAGRTVIDGQTVRFDIAGSEKARIDPSGQLGIGTTTPGTLLEVADVVTTDGVIDSTLTEGSIVFVDSSQQLVDDNANFYIDDINNRMGIGETNPQSGLHVATGFRANTFHIEDLSPTRIPFTGSTNIMDDSANLTWDDANNILDVVGNITVSGTVDGTDVAALKTDVDGFPDELKNLVTAEIQQLENIGASTISGGQWSMLGAMDQGVSSTDPVEFDYIWVYGQSGVDGTSDEVQFYIVGHSTQTANIFEIENNAEIDLFTVDPDGVVDANDLTLNNPSNVYNLSHDSFADFVANEHIDWTSASNNFSTTGTATIDGSADAVQLRVQGHSTQTNAIVEIENSAASDVLTIANDGSVAINNGATIGQAAGPLLTFDDTNNWLGLTGASLGIGTTDPCRPLHIYGATYAAQTFEEGDADTDDGIWDWEIQGEAFMGRAVTDDYQTAESWIQVDRTDSSIDAVTFPNGDVEITEDLTVGAINFAADGQGDDDYVITLSPVPDALRTGMVFYFSANTANTGACTLNVNGLGAKALKAFHDQDPPDNYIEATSIVHCIYDGTNMQLMSPDNNP